MSKYQYFQLAAKQKADKLRKLQDGIATFINTYAERIEAPKDSIFCCVVTDDGAYQPVSTADLKRGDAEWIYFWLCVQVDTNEVSNGLYGVKIGMNNRYGYLEVNVYDNRSHTAGPIKLDIAGEATLYNQISKQLGEQIA